MSLSVPCLTAFALLNLVTLPLRAQQPREPARDLVREVMYNELHDQQPDLHWEYRSHIVSPSKNQVREQIEINQGPVFRVIAENGSPLDIEQREREDRRLDEFIHDPGQIERLRREHQEDEQRLRAMMQILPQAFLFAYEGQPAENVARINFRPDPSFVPSGYEERVLGALSGAVTVNLRHKRLVDINGAVGHRVDFGYGLLGHVEKGSTFEVHREQVTRNHWKVDLVDVHIQGKLLMMKTISKDQREVRSDFRPVPGGATLAQAKQMLNQTAAAGPADQARLTHAGSGN